MRRVNWHAVGAVAFLMLLGVAAWKIAGLLWYVVWLWVAS